MTANSLPRYMLRWQGPNAPVAVPTEDGYWTPWHLAAGRPSLAATYTVKRNDGAIIGEGLGEEFARLMAASLNAAAKRHGSSDTYSVEPSAS